ncbi:MAG: thioredoxin family protein, partial [Candidatus Methanofastidiosia archaeon]
MIEDVDFGLKKAKNEGKPSLLYFRANWRGTCKAQERILEEVFPQVDAIFLKVDVEKYRELVEKYDILSVPSVVILDSEGNFKWRKSEIANDLEIKEM